jgi:hypothetical protein
VLPSSSSLLRLFSVSAGSEIQSVSKKGRLGREMMRFSRDQLMGTAFVAFGSVLFLCSFYTAIVSKLLHHTRTGFCLPSKMIGKEPQNRTDGLLTFTWLPLTIQQNTYILYLSAQQVIVSYSESSYELLLFALIFLPLTRYYCLLVPLSLPVIIVAVYLHWLSMKIFKHA